MGMEKFLFDLGMRFVRVFAAVQIVCFVLSGIAIVAVIGGTAYYFLR